MKALSSAADGIGNSGSRVGSSEAIDLRAAIDGNLDSAVIIERAEALYKADPSDENWKTRERAIAIANAQGSNSGGGTGRGAGRGAPFTGLGNVRGVGGESLTSEEFKAKYGIDPSEARGMTEEELSSKVQK